METKELYLQPQCRLRPLSYEQCILSATLGSMDEEEIIVEDY